MSELLITMGAEAIPITLGMVYLLAHRRAVHRRRCVRYADMLLVELRRILDFTEKGDLNPIMMRLAANDRAAYDGLVSSGNMAWFDTDVQASLARTYGELEEVASGEYEANFESQDTTDVIYSLYREAHDAIVDVVAFRNRNRASGRCATVLKALKLAYDG